MYYCPVPKPMHLSACLGQRGRIYVLKTESRIEPCVGPLSYGAVKYTLGIIPVEG